MMIYSRQSINDYNNSTVWGPHSTISISAIPDGSRLSLLSFILRISRYILSESTRNLYSYYHVDFSRHQMCTAELDEMLLQNKYIKLYAQ